MNKLEANISLFIITFFAAIQYVFLAGVPENIPHFAFLCITNLVGFIITTAFFFGELFRLDVKQIGQSCALSSELLLFNVFLLAGARGMDSTVTAAVLSTYFVFIVVLSAILFHLRTDAGIITGCTMVLLGLFLIMDADIFALWNRNIFYLFLSDLSFAVYILTLGRYSSSSNPSILAMGQMFFCFVFSLVFWIGECFITDAAFALPSGPAFWGSVIYISFFIRGLYGIVQTYAQRYVSALNTSLIFSTEIIITMAMSPLLASFSGSEPEAVTPLRITGAVIMVLGILMNEPAVSSRVFGLLGRRTS